jgi:hypothetical protein
VFKHVSAKLAKNLISTPFTIKEEGGDNINEKYQIFLKSSTLIFTCHRQADKWVC